MIICKSEEIKTEDDARQYVIRLIKNRFEEGQIPCFELVWKGRFWETGKIDAYCSFCNYGKVPCEIYEARGNIYLLCDLCFNSCLGNFCIYPEAHNDDIRDLARSMGYIMNALMEKINKIGS